MTFTSLLFSQCSNFFPVSSDRPSVKILLVSQQSHAVSRALSLSFYNNTNKFSLQMVQTIQKFIEQYIRVPMHPILIPNSFSKGNQHCYSFRGICIRILQRNWTNRLYIYIRNWLTWLLRPRTSIMICTPEN